MKFHLQYVEEKNNCLSWDTTIMCGSTVGGQEVQIMVHSDCFCDKSALDCIQQT